MVVNVATLDTVQQLTYDEFGVVQGDSNPGFQPFGYAGGLYDADTKLVHFGAREYDAETGRWLSKDPLVFIGGDSNFYVYVGNNPVNFFDPSGLLFGEDIDHWLIVNGYGLAEDLMKGSAIISLIALGGLAVAPELMASEVSLASGHVLLSAAGTRTSGLVDRMRNLLPKAPSAARACPKPALKLAQDVVSVYHGSINNGANILQKGLDPSRTPTFVTRDLAAAQNALANHPDAVSGAGKIIESQIPVSQFQSVLLPSERAYTGFYPYGLQSTEIVLRTALQIQLFNQFMVKP
jgi:RHS repeat-associated protein